MAQKQSNLWGRTVELAIQTPLRASIVIGTAIISIQGSLGVLMQHWHYTQWVMLAVPFIPPIIVGRASRRINERLAEHDFVKDSLPLAFIAYPNLPTKHSLNHCQPDMLSDSAQKHTGFPADELLHQPVLPSCIFEDPKQRDVIIQSLLKNYHSNNKDGHIQNLHVRIRPHSQCKEPQTYLFSSNLKRRRNHLKWQGVLIPDPNHPLFSS